MKALNGYNSCLSRQVNEAVRVTRSKENTLLNSKKNPPDTHCEGGGSLRPAWRPGREPGGSYLPKGWRARERAWRWRAKRAALT